MGSIGIIKTQPTIESINNNEYNNRKSNKNQPNYGSWNEVIKHMNKSTSTIGNNKIRWYQAEPTGNSLFISIIASLDGDTDVHNKYTNKAKQFRQEVVDNMNKLNLIKAGFDENAIAYEISDILDSNIESSENNTTPKSKMNTINVTTMKKKHTQVDSLKYSDKLFNSYKKSMRIDGFWSGELEIAIAAQVLNRPIIVFNNLNSFGVVYFPSDKLKTFHYYNENFIKGLSKPIIISQVTLKKKAFRKHYIYGLTITNKGSTKHKGSAKHKGSTKHKKKRFKTKRKPKRNIKKKAKKSNVTRFKR